MSGRDGFDHCPRCAAPGLGYEHSRHRCQACGWTFYRNAAAAVLAILEYEGAIVLVRRALEPAAGTLDLPGGFLDEGEPAESGLARELREELGVDLRDPRYVGTYPNVYRYAGVTYHTLDICFHAVLDRAPRREDMDAHELSEFVLVPRAAIDLAAIGFDSPRQALAEFLESAR